MSMRMYYLFELNNFFELMNLNIFYKLKSDIINVLSIEIKKMCWFKLIHHSNKPFCLIQENRFLSGQQQFFVGWITTKRFVVLTK